MRYAKLPATVTFDNQSAPGGKQSIDVGPLCDTLLLHPLALKALGLFAVIDLRAKMRAAAGGVVELSDQEHEVLRQVVERPETLAPVVALSEEGFAFLRAIFDASPTKPE